jgi:hypothetical protein
LERRRAPSVCSARSPPSWPSVALTLAKRSMSIVSTDTGWRRRRVRWSDRRRSNSRRLASSVNGVVGGLPMRLQAVLTRLRHVVDEPQRRGRPARPSAPATRAGVPRNASHRGASARPRRRRGGPQQRRLVQLLAEAGMRGIGDHHAARRLAGQAVGLDFGEQQVKGLADRFEVCIADERAPGRAKRCINACRRAVSSVVGWGMARVSQEEWAGIRCAAGPRSTGGTACGLHKSVGSSNSGVTDPWTRPCAELGAKTRSPCRWTARGYRYAVFCTRCQRSVGLGQAVRRLNGSSPGGRPAPPWTNFPPVGQGGGAPLRGPWRPSLPGRCLRPEAPRCPKQPIQAGEQDPAFVTDGQTQAVTAPASIWGPPSRTALNIQGPKTHNL